MNINKQKIAIELVSILIVCLVVWKITAQISLPQILATYDGGNLTSEQQLLKSRIIKVEPKFLGNVTEHGKVVSIYRLHDGDLSTMTPTLYNDGENLLPPFKKAMAEERLIPAPKLLFWRNEITIKEYNELSHIYIADIVSGVFVGMFFTGIFGCMFHKIFGFVKSLVLFTVFGLFSGFSYVLVFGTSSGLIVGITTYVTSISFFSLVLLFDKIFMRNTDETAVHE